MSDKLTLREVQEGALNILIKIDEICREENLKYSLAFGTLIGAVRHKGIIPWDDDIDIMMPRDDYDKLVQYFVEHAEELEPFKIFNPDVCDKYPYTISRISDTSYKLDVDNEKDYGIGLFVDVYPLDGIGNSVEEYTRRKNKSSRNAALCFLSTRKAVKRENTRSTLKFIIKFPAFIVAKILGKKFYMKRLFAMAKEKNYDECKYVGCIIWGSDDGLRGVYERQWLDEIIDMEFEGRMFMVPREYDVLLKRGYGDYMQLPPENQRIAHHYYDAYRIDN